MCAGRVRANRSRYSMTRRSPWTPIWASSAIGDTPESLAGIMGGASTAVSLDTTNIYMEAAFWWPESIAGRTRKLKIPSEAAHRFERGVDFENGVAHLELMTRLIIDICGGEAGPIDDQIINVPQRAPVRLRLGRVARCWALRLVGSKSHRSSGILAWPLPWMARISSLRRLRTASTSRSRKT